METEFNKHLAAKRPEWEVQQRIRTNNDEDIHREWMVDVDPLLKISNVNQMRDKLHASGLQNTEFMYKNRRF